VAIGARVEHVLRVPGHVADALAEPGTHADDASVTKRALVTTLCEQSGARGRIGRGSGARRDRGSRR
jgi:hypothetical protein